MTTLAVEEFLSWARTLNIVLDPRYPDPKCLVYGGGLGESRWWDVPAGAAELAGFVSHLLAGIEPWTTCCLWRRGGQWFSARPPQNRMAALRNLLAMGPAVPDGFEGALAYDHGENDQLANVLADRIANSYSVRDDLFVIPDSGRYIVQTDHHDVMHASSSCGSVLATLIRHMARAGYSLPRQPRDATFKRPSWLR